MNIAAGTHDPFPKCTRFEAVIQAMNFRNRGWLTTAMRAFGDALAEINIARRDYDEQVALALKSTVPSGQISLPVLAHHLQAREALLEEFARCYVDIRTEFRHFRATNGHARGRHAAIS